MKNVDLNFDCSPLNNSAFELVSRRYMFPTDWMKK
ncbi:MarR family transcriptional regulator, partial [Vibrio parahaemolyticus]